MCSDCGLVAIPYLSWWLGTVLGIILFTSLSTATINKIFYESNGREHRASYLFPPLFFVGIVAFGLRVGIAFETTLIGLFLYLFLYVFINYQTVSRQLAKAHHEEEQHADKPI